MRSLLRHKDKRWALLWVLTVGALGIWDTAFLNKPALKLVVSGFVNTFTISLLVIAMTLVMGWAVTLLLHYLESGKRRTGYLLVTFLLNLIRSIPQIVGILFGYVGVTVLLQRGILTGPFIVFPLLAFSMSLFIFLEVVDLMRDRIEHYRRLDFYNAMRVCGIKEGRIINFNILWRNSRIHVFNKLIAVLGIAVFLQCSVDFIISVGLSTDVNQVALPATLGGLLASIDSKQDILALGYSLTNPSYMSKLPFQHLQGITVAFLIVFTLLGIYNISNGYAERHRL